MSVDAVQVDVVRVDAVQVRTGAEVNAAEVVLNLLNFLQHEENHRQASMDVRPNRQRIPRNKNFAGGRRMSCTRGPIGPQRWGRALTGRADLDFHPRLRPVVLWNCTGNTGIEPRGPLDRVPRLGGSLELHAAPALAEQLPGLSRGLRGVAATRTFPDPPAHSPPPSPLPPPAAPAAASRPPPAG